MNEERMKGWLLTQERAMEIYDFVQSSLDVGEWDVPIKSENFTKLQFSEFISKAKKRIIFKPEFSNFNPTVVADDCINILETMPVTFDQIKNRMEDVFRSILVVNEDMDGYIKDIEQDKEEMKIKLEELRNENQDIRDELELTKIELEKKQFGITPLTDIINIRVKEIVKLYNEFKACIGDEKEMKKFLPIFETEVDSTLKLIELKRKQVLESETYSPKPLQYDDPAPAPENQEEDFPDDDAKFGDGEDDNDDPRTTVAKENNVPVEVFIEVTEQFRRPTQWNEEVYNAEIVIACMSKMETGKFKQPRVK